MPLYLTSIVQVLVDFYVCSLNLLINVLLFEPFYDKAKRAHPQGLANTSSMNGILKPKQRDFITLLWAILSVTLYQIFNVAVCCQF